MDAGRDIHAVECNSVCLVRRSSGVVRLNKFFFVQLLGERRQRALGGRTRAGRELGSRTADGRHVDGRWCRLVVVFWLLVVGLVLAVGSMQIDL